MNLSRNLQVKWSNWGFPMKENKIWDVTGSRHCTILYFSAPPHRLIPISLSPNLIPSKSYLALCFYSGHL
ncbi:hypothetical protein L1987_34592 [Smallanthus sonchifolius]|uniref:Uncharacterized protein n=1 Tax=Smallanthus sonchifolius TaxID=185202 RepID=A0ACB9HTQ1_9ASTR|nr:hypothetical protein L1987_34592 [Smallanthus sonchifolius]